MLETPRSALVALLSMGVALAGGCGGTTVVERTTTVVQRPQASPPRSSTSRSRDPGPRSQPTTTTSASTPEARFASCDQNIRARQPTTSCAFAQNAFYGYFENGGPGTIAVFSPVTGRTYSTDCESAAAGAITCTTATGAEVTFAQAAVDLYTPSQAAEYAAHHRVGQPIPGTPPATPPAPSTTSPGPNPSNEIPSYDEGTGYPVQCHDGLWSHSGGRPGACSGHGGVGG